MGSQWRRVETDGCEGGGGKGREVAFKEREFWSAETPETSTRVEG